MMIHYDSRNHNNPMVDSFESFIIHLGLEGRDRYTWMSVVSGILPQQSAVNSVTQQVVPCLVQPLPLGTPEGHKCQLSIH